MEVARAARRGAHHVDQVVAVELPVHVLIAGEPYRVLRQQPAVVLQFAEYEQHGVNEYWILDPETLAHRFYRRDGELLVEYAAQENRIASQVVAGFFVLREWLDPKQIPSIAGSLAQIVG